MTTLVTLRPGLSLEAEAAASWARMERDRGAPLDVNRSTVDRAKQMSMYLAYKAWKNGTGPKPDHGRAIHPDYSWHCLPRARAVDTDDDAWIRANPEYGWKFVVSGERWHAQYYPEHDKYRGTGNPATIATEQEEEEMIINIQGRTGVRNGGAYYIANGVATFLGASVKGVPTLDFDAGTRLAKRVSGI